MFKILLVICRILQGIGILTMLVGSLWILGWYIHWIDSNFLWRFLASIVGLITCPISPFAVLIEWLWHGWPHEVTVGVAINVSGWITAVIFGVLANWLDEKSCINHESTA